MESIKYDVTEYGTCAKLSYQQALTLMTQADIDAGIKRGSMKTWGMWQQPVSYTAIAVDEKARVIYGPRALTHIQQLGYEIEGRVCVNGKRVRGFSSSLLIELPDKKLIDLAIIYVCMNQPKG